MEELPMYNRGHVRDGRISKKQDGLLQRIEIGATIRARLEMLLDFPTSWRIQIFVKVVANVTVHTSALHTPTPSWRLMYGLS